MCYGSCPFQGSFSGECSAPLKNSKNFDAHCNTDFECIVCGDLTTEENAGQEDCVCIDCEAQERKDVENGLTVGIK